jgi:hypothetical protein
MAIHFTSGNLGESDCVRVEPVSVFVRIACANVLSTRYSFLVYMFECMLQLCVHVTIRMYVSGNTCVYICIDARFGIRVWGY